MAQVVQTRGRMRATIHPAQAVAQFVEDAMCLPLTEGLPKTTAPTADQEWHVSRRGNMLGSLPPIAGQRFERAGMDGHLTRLGELGLPDSQDSAFEIDIGIAQMNRLGDTQASRCHQAEQGLEGSKASDCRR